MTAQTDQALRDWARGSLTLTAAVEMLIAADEGRWAATWQPWIHVESGGTCWVDWESLHHHATTGPFSGGERRFLQIAASLGGDDIAVNLGDVVTGLDRQHLELVTEAIAAAGNLEGARAGEARIAELRARAAGED